MTLQAFNTLIFLPPQAYTGHYTVSYSGGTINGRPYTLIQSGYSGSASFGTLVQRYIDYPSITCNGQITATFTWVADVPKEPPPAVVVQEQCQAAWHCIYSSMLANPPIPKGQADNGLGFPETSTGHAPYSYGGLSGGKQYRIITAAAGKDLATFQVTCNPTASVTVGVNFGYIQDAGASITYSAMATPLMVVLGGSGINLNTQPEYLIGQQVTCSLNPGDLTPSNYHWTPPASCQPFKQWKLTDFFYNDIDKPQTVQLILLTNQDLTQSTLTFYPKVPTSGIFQCTVDLTVPQGAHWDDGSTTKTVTAQSRYIGFRPPDPPSPPSSDQPAPPVLTAAFTPANGTIGLDPSSGQMSVGAAYTYQVKTPTEFITSSDTGAVTLFIYFTPTISVFSGNASFLFDDSANMGINGSFPVPGVSQSPDGKPIVYGDRSSVTPNDPYITGANATMSFHVWLMYRPPAPSYWVPLADIGWGWQGEETLHLGTPFWLLNSGALTLNSPATLNVFTYPAFPPNWQNPEFNLKYLWNTDVLLLDSHSTNIP